MKRQVICVSLAVVSLFYLASCSTQKTNQKELYVTIEDGTSFPDYLAGTWVQEGLQGRAFTFTQEGKLESIILGLGQVEIKTGTITRIPLKKNGKGIFVPGKWNASYDPRTRQLGVEINIESFKMQMGQQIVEGKTKELFIGIISEDGKKWTADYISYPKYYATTEDGKKYQLVNGEEMMEETIVFEKIEED